MTQSPDSGSYVAGQGFRLIETDMGEVRFRLYTYIRYLMQEGLEPTFTDAFGVTDTLDLRHDSQVNKAVLYFLGWFIDPRFRYFFYVWSTNTSQGLATQVIVAGNLTYRFGARLTVGAGITSLPGVRSTEGNFPFWLMVDNRSIADEFFRPSYTSGFWIGGEIARGLTYDAMIGNNLSHLGVDAGELDNGFDTFSAAVVWYPTTGEFGRRGQFGDFDGHDRVATRVGVHFTRSTETRQSQSSADGFDNVQIRLSDGNPIFEPGLLGPGIQVETATYRMSAVDAGIKYRGLALEGEYYWRWVTDLEGPGSASFPFHEFDDSGFQLLASAMVLPRSTQLYAVGSKVLGDHGDPWELRGGVNFYPWKTQAVRCNLEYIHLDRSPVGGLSLPYAVGATGPIVHFNIQVDF
jgi:hypothetical protein